jgi:tRNA-binding EMAP/Myf-like protein
VKKIFLLLFLTKIHLKIGKIIHAENIPGMKRVLKVIVDIGRDRRNVMYAPRFFINQKN